MSLLEPPHPDSYNIDLAESWRTLGTKLIKECELDESLEAFKKAIIYYSDLVLSPLNDLAVGYLESRQLEQAEIICKKSLDVFPDAVVTLLILARIRILQTRLEDGESLLNKVITIKPLSDAYFYRSKLRERLNQFDESLKDLELAIQMQPTKAEYYEFKIHLLNRIKHHKKVYPVNSFLMYLNLDEYIDKNIVTNSFELCTEKWLKDFIEPGQTIIDIGANIGYFSLVSSEHIGDGKIFAVEPTRYGYQELEKNIAINNFSNIIPKKIALGSCNQKNVNISYKPDNYTTGDVTGIRSSWLNQEGKVTSVQIETEDYCDFITLDTFVEQQEINRLDILKIDVDGLELNVLKGGINSILNFKPVIILELEYNRNQNSSGDLKGELLDIISQFFESGYSAISEAGVCLRDIKSLISNLLYYKNRKKTPGNYLFTSEKHKPIRFAKNKGNDFKGRIKDVLSCPYNKGIPRVKDAGMVVNDVQIMHNGLKVYIDSYYPQLVVPLLEQNRGVHEPEEEIHFLRILNLIHSKQPTIVELGSYWAFYSMWFLKKLPNSRAYMVQPDQEKLKCGQKNFELNSLIGDWTQSYVGAKHLNLDPFLLSKEIDSVDILHSDIQGAELEMLVGAKNAFTERKINYAFISTHSQKLHLQCLEYFNQYDYYIVYSADFYQTRCCDGVIVASSEALTFNI
jgi:FkbM family methyltransferase